MILTRRNHNRSSKNYWARPHIFRYLNQTRKLCHRKTNVRNALSYKRPERNFLEEKKNKNQNGFPRSRKIAREKCVNQMVARESSNSIENVCTSYLTKLYKSCTKCSIDYDRYPHTQRKRARTMRTACTHTQRKPPRWIELQSQVSERWQLWRQRTVVREPEFI